MATTDQFKVKLINSSNRREQVHFDVTPDVNETTNVNYKTIDPIHAPGQIMAYSNTNSRTFNISNIRFINRTVEEADLNLKRLWILRSWTKPIFGQTTLSGRQREWRTELTALENKPREEYGTSGIGDSYRQNWFENQDLGAELRGKPPAVVLLSAYSRPGSIGNTMEHINRVPCVIDQFSIPYPSDVDYIHTSTGVPMPMMMSLDVVLRETHSPLEYSNFNIFSYKNGTLRGF